MVLGEGSVPPFGAVAVGVSFLPGSINLTGCIGRASVPVRRGAQCSSAVCTDALDIGLLYRLLDMLS